MVIMTKNIVENTKILVTGASGYVGAKIYQDLKDIGFEVVGTYYTQKLFVDLVKCDITNRDEVKQLFSAHKPDIVIHSAANPSNSSAEKDPKSANNLNVTATEYLVNESRKTNTKFIFISTFAAYNATGVYGQSKLTAEKIVSLLSKYIILRPSLIIGLSPNTENDRPFNRIIKNIVNKDSHTEYDNSWKFNVTFLSHLSKICIEIIEKELFINDVLPVASNAISSRYKISQDILKNFNIKVTEIDEGRGTVEPEIDWSIYKKLGLSEMTYIEGIAEIVEDLKYLDTL